MIVYVKKIDFNMIKQSEMRNLFVFTCFNELDSCRKSKTTVP